MALNDLSFNELSNYIQPLMSKINELTPLKEKVVINFICEHKRMNFTLDNHSYSFMLIPYLLQIAIDPH